MKLYTEEQVKRMMELARETYVSEGQLLLSFDPIELPSDEEISKEAMDLFDVKSNSIFDILQARAFKRGVIWLLDIIQGGNK